MNEVLSLSLELSERTRRLLRFRLKAENQFAVKLLLPKPEITQLHFLSETTSKESQWRWSSFSFISTSLATLTLKPGESRDFEWRVRPSDIEPPPQNKHDDSSFDYCRRCIDLSFGEYLVWFHWRVSTAFIDYPSHSRWRDLESLAQQEGAVAWYGEAESNWLHITRPLV
jgi:hypothetical protein